MIVARSCLRISVPTQRRSLESMGCLVLLSKRLTRPIISIGPGLLRFLLLAAPVTCTLMHGTIRGGTLGNVWRCCRLLALKSFLSLILCSTNPSVGLLELHLRFGRTLGLFGPFRQFLQPVFLTGCVLQGSGWWFRKCFCFNC
jgi:hypothetical protein